VRNRFDRLLARAARARRATVGSIAGTLYLRA
jgi:hypothetical protein